MTQIGVLINRQAGSVKRNPAWLQQMERLLPQGRVRVTASAEDVVPALESLRSSGVGTLMLCGGDGTVGGTLTALLECWPESELPRIVMAPGGTVNTIPKSLGASAKPPDVLERLIEREERDENGLEKIEFLRPLLRTHSSDGVARAGMIFANGTGVRFLEMYYEDSGRGPLGAGSVVARIVASSLTRSRLAREMFAPAAVRVKVDERTLGIEQFTAMVAGTVHHIGIGFRPFSMADRDPGRFHFAISEASSMQLVRELPDLRVGRTRKGSRVDHYCAERVEMEFDEPQPWSLDADIYPPTLRLVLEATKPLRFCAP